MMNQLTFYVSEKQHQDGKPLYEWLLEQGRSLGIHGGSAFRAMAGFGRHGRMHEDTFFELAGELPVRVEFVLADESVEQFMDLLQPYDLKIYFVSFPVKSGFI